MASLLISAALFLFLHRGISGSPLRGVIVKSIGEVAYGRLFALASVAALAWLGIAYAGTTAADAFRTLWTTYPLVRDLQLIVQPLAVLLMLTGLTTPNPGTFRQEAIADRKDNVRGILRVTRHPFLWGVALFALGHILAAPTVRNLVLFGTLLFVSVTGTFSIDAKRQRALGSKWSEFAGQTSNFPFVAIATDRQQLRPGEIGWIKLGFWIALSVTLTLAHSVLFGVGAIGNSAH